MYFNSLSANKSTRFAVWQVNIDGQIDEYKNKYNTQVKSFEMIYDENFMRSKSIIGINAISTV